MVSYHVKSWATTKLLIGMMIKVVRVSFVVVNELNCVVVCIS